MLENKRIAIKKAQSRNRLIRHRTRQQHKLNMQRRLGITPFYFCVRSIPLDEAERRMRGKDVHKTKGGRSMLIDHKEHCINL